MISSGPRRVLGVRVGAGTGGFRRESGPAFGFRTSSRDVWIFPGSEGGRETGLCREGSRDSRNPTRPNDLAWLVD